MEILMEGAETWSTQKTLDTNLLLFVAFLYNIKMPNIRANLKHSL